MNERHFVLSSSFIVPRSSFSLLCALAFALTALVGVMSSAMGGAFVTPGKSAKAKEPARAKRAIVISLDGLDVRYLRRADEFGLKIPALRKLMKDGVRAGVVAVYPSVTYPNHTTMVTGATPARHGVFGNMVFDPADPNLKAGYWFARDIKADTLWDAASRAGRKTALVSWPAAAGAGDWNAPEIWKPGGSQEDTLKEIKKHARPAGLIEEIAARDPDLYRHVTKDEQDDMRTRFAEHIISTKKPDLVLVHLFDLDHFEHDYGPFTPEAFAILEKADGYVARILAAAERAGTLPETAVFIVSDHGFKEFSQRINPGVILRRAGLVSVREERDEKGESRAVITDWRAMFWETGGAAAIMLRDPHDKEALRRARAALEDAAARGGGHPLFRVLEADEVRRLGSNTRAAFMLEASEGYAFGTNLTGEVVTNSKLRGMHGYLPAPENYRASLIASGAGVKRRGDAGTARMIDIGPTVARALGLTLRDAGGRAIKLR